MRISQLFTKTRKEVPSQEEAKNAQLLIKAGYIYKVMAGAYALTPLGLRVVEKIKSIAREEMNNIGGQEIIMTSLQSSEVWKTTGRWDDEAVDIWFKSKLKDETEVGFGWSHEEPIIEMMKLYIKSYKDLPSSVYQFQTKLRNELRAKSGILRGREFLMKDMYSFSANADQHDKFYDAVIKAYTKIFRRVGLGDDTFVTFASGGAFTQFSHEFQTICESGEDVIYLHREKNIAINEEVFNEETLKKININQNELEKVKCSEVGNIFNFGTEKSEIMDFSFINEAGKKQFVHLGSYGIGITRVMGVVVEKFSDERGIVWPESIAPAIVHLCLLGDDVGRAQFAEDIYKTLQSAGVETIFDDRPESAGTKLADADLLGCPIRLIISKNTKDKIEFKYRTEQESILFSTAELLDKLKPSI